MNIHAPALADMLPHFAISLTWQYKEKGKLLYVA
jgi:hypothetical protein